MAIATYFNLWTQTEKTWDTDTGPFFAVGPKGGQGAPQSTLDRAVAQLALYIARMPEWATAKIYRGPCLFSREDCWIEQAFTIPPEVMADAAEVNRRGNAVWAKEIFERKYHLSVTFM